MDLVKSHFQARVDSRMKKEEVEVDEQLWKLIKPTSYLKSYNLTPAKCDYFVNKIKNEKDRQLTSFSIGFGDPMPQNTLELPQTMKQSKLYRAVSTFMEKRPCWLRNVLLVTLKQEQIWDQFSPNQLKNVLKHLCYTFRNGPWKHTFCAFGFDPRANQKAIIYQNVSLKLKKK